MQLSCVLIKTRGGLHLISWPLASNTKQNNVLKVAVVLILFFGTRKLFSVAALSSINLVLYKKPSVNFCSSYLIYLEFIST